MHRSIKQADASASGLRFSIILFSLMRINKPCGVGFPTYPWDTEIGRTDRPNEVVSLEELLDQPRAGTSVAQPTNQNKSE